MFTLYRAIQMHPLNLLLAGCLKMKDKTLQRKQVLLRLSKRKLPRLVQADDGITEKMFDRHILIVTGTDGGEAFALEHELELYAGRHTSAKRFAWRLLITRQRLQPASAIWNDKERLCSRYDSYRW